MPASSRPLPRHPASADDRDARRDQLRHVAEHDALTGLLNRRAFVARVVGHIAERRVVDDPDDIVVLFCDLDRFEAVNDRHGHAAGDAVLMAAAARIRSCPREGDVVGRWGGDEFTVLLRGSPGAETVAELSGRITSAFDGPIALGPTTFDVGVSVGSSRAPVATADPSDLLRAADESMYRRKGAGSRHR